MNHDERTKKIEAVLSDEFIRDLKERTGADGLVVLAFMDGNTCGRPGETGCVTAANAPFGFIPAMVTELPRVGLQMLTGALEQHTEAIANGHICREHSDEKESKALPPSLEKMLGDIVKKSNRKGIQNG